MSKIEDEEKKEYAIGHKRPPVRNRFQKGKSGNPKGRPKGAQNKVSEESLHALVTKEMYRSITVYDGNQPIQLSIAEAIIRSVTVKAVKGDTRAQIFFIELLEKIDALRKEVQPQKITISWLEPGENPNDKS